MTWIANQAPGLAKKAALAFWNAWWGAGFWGKTITAAVLAKKLGVAGAMSTLTGNILNTVLGGKGGKGGGVLGSLMSRGSTAANPLYVWSVNGGGKGPGGLPIPMPKKACPAGSPGPLPAPCAIRLS